MRVHQLLIKHSSVAEAEGYGSQIFSGLDTEAFSIREDNQSIVDTAGLVDEDMLTAGGQSEEFEEEENDLNTTPSISPAPPKWQPRAQVKNAKQQMPQRQSARIEKLKSQSPTREVSPRRPASKGGRGRPRINQAGPNQARKKSDKEWEVEKILESRIDSETYEHFYKVKWKGFSAKESTWEPKVNLTHCRESIEKFEAGNKQQD